MSEPKQIGSTTPAISVALLACVLILGVIVFEERDKRISGDNHLRERQEAKEAFDRELHTSQEMTAIAYAQLRAQFNISKQGCDDNTQNFQAIKIWLRQHVKDSPPPNILTEKPCSAPEKKEEK